MRSNKKRRLLTLLSSQALLTLGSGVALGAESPRSAQALVFPRDHGAHFDTGIEWWYVTGFLTSQGSTEQGQTAKEHVGFQITFFRRATGQSVANASRFSPRQLVFSHVALASKPFGKLIHEQAAYRLGFDSLAALDERDTQLRVLRSTMVRRGERYAIDIVTDGIEMSLQLEAKFGPVLQGNNGRSQKGSVKRRLPNSTPSNGTSNTPFSYYYSRPQLAVTGAITRVVAPSSTEIPKEARALLGKYAGTAWLDHEWSDHLLDDAAAGWDWMGLNFDDGESLMAFRIRPKISVAVTAASGETGPSAMAPLWSEARRFDRYGKTVWSIANEASPSQRAEKVQFKVLRTWRSLRSNALYPVEMEITLGSKSTHAKTFTLRPLMDDQEIDARRSTGGFYWEGLVLVFEGERRVGQGYLELTGYAEALRF